MSGRAGRLRAMFAREENARADSAEARLAAVTADRDALRVAALEACAGWEAMDKHCVGGAARHGKAMEALYLVAHKGGG